MTLELRVRPKEGMEIVELLKLMCSLDSEMSYNANEGIISIKVIRKGSMEKAIQVINELFYIEKIEKMLEDDKNNVKHDTESCDKPNEIKFIEPCIEVQINKLIREIYSTMRMHLVNSKTICEYVNGAREEIRMRYNPNVGDVEIGDVVRCNLGSTLKDESGGTDVYAVICSVESNNIMLFQ